jgi:hypothetical protein
MQQYNLKIRQMSVTDYYHHGHNDSRLYMSYNSSKDVIEAFRVVPMVYTNSIICGYVGIFKEDFSRIKKRTLCHLINSSCGVLVDFCDMSTVTHEPPSREIMIGDTVLVDWYDNTTVCEPVANKLSDEPVLWIGFELARPVLGVYNLRREGEGLYTAQIESHSMMHLDMFGCSESDYTKVKHHIAMISSLIVSLRNSEDTSTPIKRGFNWVSANQKYNKNKRAR